MTNEIFDEEKQLLFQERNRRLEWWRVLKILRNEYTGIVDAVQGQFDVDSFDKFLEVNHGVKIIYDHQGNITGSYNIVDKNKHLILLMKYGK